MIEFPETPHIHPYDIGWWELQEDYRYQWAKDGEEYRLIVREGFVYNLSSVPWWLRWYIGRQDLGYGPPLFHDGLYACQGFTFDYEFVSYQIYVGGEMAGGWAEHDEAWSRYNADRLFGRHMREIDIPKIRRRRAYKAVSFFGDSAWSGFRKGNEKP